ncbi:uncharacterized protein DS421_13g410090 [Arachis hypogaea]|nr:uncharacterized protein DS421_13g410090 [Arachis hypogaea]
MGFGMECFGHRFNVEAVRLSFLVGLFEVGFPSPKKPLEIMSISFWPILILGSLSSMENESSLSSYLFLVFFFVFTMSSEIFLKFFILKPLFNPSGKVFAILCVMPIGLVILALKS